MTRRAAIVAALALVSLLAGCAGVDPVRPAVLPTPSPSVSTPTTFAVVGDSLSAGCVPYPGTTPDDCSWIFSADDDPRLEYVGGWVQSGAQSTLMAESVSPGRADVLVILAGTNNVFGNVPLSRLQTDLDSITDTVESRDVLLLAIPPMESEAGTTTVADVNAYLKLLAADRGWNYFDPWSEYRAEDGHWVTGVAPDGVHPTADIQQTTGRRIAAYIDGLTL
ncbi:SGNH/GDSL hydrolase family protein [Amnibacterium flavum]|uniref:SGNH hydrolase-type esterase domain-containing protein n=1 Tax=Amnibacterium flavum TaxID=2173173 RepID=A0A2V1HY88_9MICO|nr:SGNH/GDSL hydrolase family protein [Amnibacterium flavum]PVZ95394.1 hypothetical protein DDQ50_02430 [Amnibacterium flavum]